MRRRIIPARAGFTRAGMTRGPAGADHPRSRGVYSGRELMHPAAPGSSPLARGLPHDGPARRRSGGIIPARAGFTHRDAGPVGQVPDHPRSRGVYLNQSTTSWTAVGSSPLARGLRHESAAVAGRHRIIPARAGFTRQDDRRRDATRDHPRSRGVYLRTAYRQGVMYWIIPARAGFTA